MRTLANKFLADIPELPHLEQEAPDNEQEKVLEKEEIVIDEAEEARLRNLLFLQGPARILPAPVREGPSGAEMDLIAADTTYFAPRGHLTYYPTSLFLAAKALPTDATGGLVGGTLPRSVEN